MSIAESTTWKPTNEQYHASDEIGHSMLKAFRKSRRDYYAIYEAKTKAKPEPSDEMNLGTAAHTAILESEELHKRMAFAPQCDRRTKEGKSLWGEFMAQSIGKLVLPWEYREALSGIVGAVRSNEAAQAILEAAASREVSIRWEDPATGLQLKSRLDAPVGDEPTIIADLKTCRDVSPPGFARAMAALGYHTQSAFYVDGCKAVFGIEPTFVFIAVSNCAPFSCAVYRVKPEVIERGRNLNRRALNNLAACYETDDWREPWEKQGPSDVWDLGLPRYETYEDQWEIEV